MKKKLLALLLAIIMIVGGTQGNVFAVTVSSDDSTESEITGQPFELVQNEINDAQDNVETAVSIDEDINVESSIVIPSGKNIKFDLQGFIISSTSKAPVFIVEENAKLTLTGAGIVQNTYDSGISISNAGELILEEVTVQATGAGGIAVSTSETSDETGDYSIGSTSYTTSSINDSIYKITVATVTAPSDLAVTLNSYNSVSLNWTASTGANSYAVYRSTSETSGYTKINSVTTNTYTDTTVSCGTKYYYKVVPVVGSAEGEDSNIVSVSVVPTAPSKVTVSNITYNQNKITWTAVSGATEYRVYRSTSPTSGFKRIVRLSTDKTYYYDNGVSNGQTYYYIVRACNNSTFGLKCYSTSVKSVITSTSLITATGTSYTTATVKWTAVSGATKYYLYQSTSQSSGYKRIATLSSSVRSYKASSLKFGTTYYYKVYAVKDSVRGRSSSVVSATPVPNKVTGLTSTYYGTNKVKLKWSAATGAEQYYIYVSTSKHSGYKRIKITTSLSYVYTGLTLGNTYYFKVRAVSGSLKGTSAVTSYVNAKGITLSSTSITLDVGDTKRLTATLLPTTLSSSSVTWKSSNNSIIKVSHRGNVRAVAGGTAYVYATTQNGIKVKCKVVVDDTTVIVLDPGHGGWDSGAYYNGVAEKTLNLKVSLYTRAELLKYDDVKVYMTRTTDTYVGLAARYEYADSKNADILISQHFNASTYHNVTGASVYISLNSKYNSSSKTLANNILNTLCASTGISRKGIYTRESGTTPGVDYYAVIRGSVANGFPGIIIENAFMDSSDYSKYLNTDAKLKQIGVANAKAIASYYGLTK